MAEQDVPTGVFPTIATIPAGFKWSLEAAQTAAEKGAFLRVGGKQVTRRYLSGAKRSWASTDPNENQSIFNVSYRITGTPENIAYALRHAGISDADINAIIADSITANNWQTTKAGEYEAEVARREQTKATQKAPEASHTWNQIQWMAKNIKTAVIQTKSGETKTGVTSPGRGGGESLVDRYNKLGANEVLDVSHMDLQTGKGVRKINRPRSDKAGKFGTEIKVISNNVDTYRAALRLIFGDVADVEQNVQQVQSQLNNYNLRKTQGQTATKPVVQGYPVGGAVLPGAQIGAVPNLRPRSPARAPSPARGGNLAPVPQFTAAPARPGVASPVGGAGLVPTTGGANLPNLPAIGNLFQAPR